MGTSGTANFEKWPLLHSRVYQYWWIPLTSFLYDAGVENARGLVLRTGFRSQH